ncbi:MAG: methionine gamma-lyase family protein [Clostridia bacterium]|nr:methionine gamma-lyase family protein [Clostridia bacterium]
MDINQFIDACEADCAAQFAAIDRRALAGTRRVLCAFSEHQVAARHFSPTTGYGYDDIGRDTLESIVASLFGADAAIVRPQIASGTHALALCLFGLLKPGDHLLAATGMPYDTLEGVIGKDGQPAGSLSEMGVQFDAVPLREDGSIDLPAVMASIRPETRVVSLQRSRGYAWRDAISPLQMKPLFDAVHAARPDIFIMVDNCYGAFVCDEEPTHLGADVAVGSLIKNLGGGLAPTGGYIAGTSDAVDRISARLTAPGIGREVGSYAASYQPFYQGLFMAPHTVAQALKTAVLTARVFEKLGMKTSPAYDAPRADIIQAIEMGTPKRLEALCKGVQAASPVDSFVVPEAWDMPGYEDPVIMAAGTFVGGASIELSADAPMRPPYAAYWQGGLTYEHGRLAVQSVLEYLQKDGCL